MISKRLAALLVCVAALGAPAGREAFAQAPAVGASEADALFKEGRRLYDEHKLDEACKKLDASQRLRSSINTIGLLAACHEEQGRLATALREYLKTEELARAAKDSRADFARQRAEALKPKVPVLVIRLARSHEGLSITQNGERVPEAGIGAATLVDPGEIEIVASAPGRKEWRKTASITAGSKTEVEIPELAPDVALEAPPPGGGMSSTRVAGIVIGGIGIAAVGVGAGLGVAAIGKVKESDAGCMGNECNAAGTRARNDARSLALGSTIGIVAGIVGVGAGLTLFFIGGSKAAPQAPTATSARWLQIAPSVGPTSAGATVFGAF